MNRFSATLCLGLSAFAVALASFALLQSGSDGARTSVAGEESVRELRLAVDSLRDKVEQLEAEQSVPTVPKRLPGKRRAKKQSPAQAEPADLQEQVAALTQRLASLEDDETIARLAQSGEEQVVQKQLNSALDRIGDPEADPEERLEALEDLRGLRKQHWPLVAAAMKENEITERDIVMPMLELAQDTTLEPEFRAEVLYSLDSEVPELRQPLLDMFAYEDSPEVRGGSMRALMWHLGDADVRSAIRTASQEDRHEAVRSEAQRYLPKVQHFDREAAEVERAAANRASAGGTATTGGDK